MAYYTNLLNMGEPVSVQPLPQPLLTSPFDYTDTGLLPINIPTYAAPQPFAPVVPAPVAGSTAPVAPVANVPLDDYDAELNLENEFSQNSSNAFSSLNPGRSSVLSVLSTLAPAPFGTALGAVNAFNAFQAQAFNQELANVAKNRSFAETLSESLGLGYSGGIGGYGRGGRGGYTGAMDYTDPGVAGAARAAARSALNNAVGFSIDYAPGTAGWDAAISDLPDGYTGVGPDEGDESGGYGDYDSGDYSDSDDGGFGDNSDW